MSSEKWSGGEETEKSEQSQETVPKSEKKSRKLSWQESLSSLKPPKVLTRDEAIKLESTTENGTLSDHVVHGSISDGELSRSKSERTPRGRRLERGNPSSASFRSSHRRVKSLIRFELNDYTIGDIRQLHERMASRQTKPFRTKSWFFSGFTRQQKLVLSCLCLVDFTSFCSMSIMAPFFPKEAKEKGMSETTSGFVFSFYALVIFLSSPVLGKVGCACTCTEVRQALKEKKEFYLNLATQVGPILSKNDTQMPVSQQSYKGSQETVLEDVRAEEDLPTKIMAGHPEREKYECCWRSEIQIEKSWKYAQPVCFVDREKLPKIGAKFLLLAGLFLTSNCNFIFGLLGYIREDWVFALFCFLVQGLKALGASAYCTATYVFVADIFPSNIGAVLGLMETFVGLGMSVGPAIGGFFYHIGGFGLPFYVLGIILLLTFPIAFWLLPNIEGGHVKKKSGSFLEIITEPSVIIIGLVVIITSNVWAFLDPTLEPHLRQFSLTPEKIGFIFLLFSALYGLSSPLWGVVSDKTDNHWFMMTSGLLVSTVALLILGPTPFIPVLPNTLTMNLIALAILGISVSLSLLPTFQGLLSSISLARGNSRYDLTTYSLVAGTWSSLYALGEVIGPLMGGVITENYGFPTCCTVMAAATFTLAIGSFIYFIIRDCLSERGKNYRYKFEDSDGYDTDYSNISDNQTQPLLQSGNHQKWLYTQENSF